MNTIERTIWLGLVIVMITVLAVSTFSNGTTGKEEVKASVVNSVKERTTRQHFFVQMDIGNDYIISTDINAHPLGLSKFYGANNFVGIDVSTRDMTAEQFLDEFREEYNGELPPTFEGPNGWKYMLSKTWDPTLQAAVFGNISRTFLKEYEGSLVIIEESDYLGGEFDNEIDDFIEGITLHGANWGE